MPTEKKINDEIKAEIMKYIGEMEKITGKKFGDLEILCSYPFVPDSRASMPGMWIPS
jgi:pyruvate,orthophosphate dikinase